MTAILRLQLDDKDPVRVNSAINQLAEFSDRNVRTKLTSNATFYVSTAGSDSNDGLSLGKPFLTLQHAWDVIVTIDLGGFSATIQLADGIYSGLFAIVPPVGGIVVIAGNASTPANVVVNDTITIDCKADVTLQNFEVRSTQYGIVPTNGALIRSNTGMRYGTCTTAHMRPVGTGYILVTAAYSVVGAAAAHYLAELGGTVELANFAITLTGTLGFGLGYATVTGGGKISAFNCTYTGGTITGPRFNISGGGFINTFGGGANYFPGNSIGIGGSTLGGGVYS